MRLYEHVRAATNTMKQRFMTYTAFLVGIGGNVEYDTQRQEAMSTHDGHLHFWKDLVKSSLV